MLKSVEVYVDKYNLCSSFLFVDKKHENNPDEYVWCNICDGFNGAFDPVDIPDDIEFDRLYFVFIINEPRSEIYKQLHPSLEKSLTIFKQFFDIYIPHSW